MNCKSIPRYFFLQNMVRFVTVLFVFAIYAATMANAQTLNWDPGLTGGSSGGGAGTWNLNTTANWYNGTADVFWLDNSAGGSNAAVFAGTAGTVTLNSSLSASNLQFTSSGYTISGSGTLTLGAGGINASSLSSGTTILGTALSLAAGQQAWQIGGGGTLAINGSVTRSTGASVDVSATGVTTTSPNLVNDAGGILDGWATSGDYFPSTTTGDFLSDSNGAVVISTNYTIISSTGNTTPNVASISGQNLVSGALNGANDITTITNNVAINSLVQQGDFNINDGATVTISSGGLIQRGNSRWLLDNGGGNRGTAVLESGLPSGEFFLHTPNPAATDWRIWPQINDNGVTPGIVVKDGPGIVNLQNANSYSGGTIINNGFLTPGRDNSVTNPVSLGIGTVTVNSGGTLEVGFGTANANINYFVTNSLVIAGGKALSDDGHQRLSGPISILAGGATFGSTYDGGANGSTGNKALFIDGLVSGSGPITLEQSMQAGALDRYGNGNGNPYNSSVVEFGNNANAYSGTITTVPYTTGGGAGSFVAVNGSTALQFATLNLANNTGGQRFAGLGGTFTPMIFNTGLGSATLGAITGSGNIILQGYNENTYALNSDPIALTVGNNNSSTTFSGNILGSGSLTKIGSGILTLSGANNYTGNTAVSSGTLSLTAAWVNSTNIMVSHGALLDVSTLGSTTMTGSQILSSAGTINGSINTSSGSQIHSDVNGGYGTNVLNNNLTLASGAVVYFNVGALANGSNDLMTVGGTVSANNNIVHVSAPSTSVSLQATDYTLITSANPISGSFSSAPQWDVAPVNSGNYSIVTSGNTVKLHYATFTSPSGNGTASPNPALRNQYVLITVNANNGSAGTVNSVTVDTSSVGGSAALTLVNAGGNVWTNTVAVAPGTSTGVVNLVATITDTASLSGIANIPLTIAAGNDVWNGNGADNNWSTGLNWANQFAPGYVGDSLRFGGVKQLNPNMDNNYTITSLLFDGTAGSFTIGSSGGSTLTLSGNGPITNNSPNLQTLNLTIGDSGGGLTKYGAGPVNLAGNNNYTGPTVVNAGTLNISGTIASSANASVGNIAGNSILDVSGTGSISPFYLLLGNITNSVAAVYQTGGSVNASANSGFDNLSVGNTPAAYGYYDAAGGSLTANGVCVAGEDNSGSGANFGNPGGNGIMDINGATVSDTGWFVMTRNSAAQTGILNVYSGSLTFAGGGLVCNWGSGQTAVVNVLGGSVTSLSQGVGLGSAGNPAVLNVDGGLVGARTVGGNFGGTGGQLNFNGGTLQASGFAGNFISVSSAYVYSGGAIIDNFGSVITNQQPLLAPSGNGIYSATVSTPGAGYIAPPFVTIVRGTGDTTGTGATAIAQINTATGTVTNVVITSPGINYTATPTFVLSGGGASVQATVTSAAPVANTSGGLTIVDTGGGGYISLSGANTYSGATVISNGTLSLVTGGSINNSSNIITENGAMFDVSSLASYTLLGSQALSGFGNVSGSVSAAAASRIYGGTDGTYGTNTFNNDLTLVSGAGCYLDVGTVYNGSNDQIVVTGTLTANGNSLHLKAPSNSSSLDTTADYLLITAGSISGSFATAPIWDVAPVNAGHYTIVTSGTTVTLHYNAAVSSPSVTGTATPSTLLRNQSFVIAANVTPGSASISSVTADLTSLGGSVVALVQSNASNIYTNTAVVPASATPGAANVTVTATDSATLSGSSSVPLTINTSTEVWNGGGANQNWSGNLNWASTMAPGYVGDTLVFAGSTRTSPNMDTNYSITGLTFSNNASSFNIGSAGGNTLTLSANGVVNNSASAQTLNVPVALTVAQSFDTGTGGITVSGAVSDSGGGLTKSGSGVLTLSASNSYTGPTIVNAGILNISGTNASTANLFVGSLASNSVLNVSGSISPFYLLLGNVSGAAAAVYQTGGSVNANANSGFDNLSVGNVFGSYGYYGANGGTFTVGGICIGGENNNGGGANFNATGGNGIVEVNGGSVSDTGWLVIARQNGGTLGPSTGILNVYGGLLTYAGGGIVGPWDTNESAVINVMGGMVSNTAAVGVYLGNVGYEGVLNLDGGTLQASVVQGYNGPTYTPVTYGQLNFNGGTLQASAANGAFIAVNAADIFSGGATINNNGTPITVSQPLLAPAGAGVYSATVSSGGAGYIAPPIVTVTNGTGDTTGTGATAIAQINPATGAVTNIVITCPGINYTATPVFIVSGGGAITPAVITGTAPVANTSGGLTSTGSGTLTLAGANTYTGNTTVSGGTLALGASGSIANSSTINVAGGATLNVAANAGFAVAAAQTLEGNGSITGNVNNNGTIMPASAGSIGTLSFNNNLSLQSGGTVSVKLNKSLAPGATNDEIACTGTVTFGGTLAVANLGGALQAGDSFQLFTAGSSAGNFANITGSPGAGLSYSFNPSTGVLSVVTGSAGISSLKFVGHVTISGNSVSFTQTNSGSGTEYLLTSTNVAAPLKTWSPVWTNVLSGSGTLSTSVPNAVVPGNSRQFYILSTTNN